MATVRSFIIMMILLPFGLFRAQINPCADAGHNHQCDIDAEMVNCHHERQIQLNNLFTTHDFQNRFLSEFNLSVEELIALNPIHTFFLKDEVLNNICNENLSLQAAEDLIFSVIRRDSDQLLFTPQFEDGFDVVGKYYKIPHEGNDAFGFKSRAADEPCNNADFETCDYTGWETYCGAVNGNPYEVINLQLYTPGSGCSGSGADQHLIVTGGNDPITGVSMVNPNGGSCSVRIGDGTGTGSRAGAMVQTFLVEATSTILTYSYAAILQDPNDHSPGEKPFVRVRLYDESGQSIDCARYEAYAGDGQPGWITQGGVTYRDWTTVFTSLEAYVGTNVTLEVSTGDCSLSGHYGYAYFDASCGVLEIEARCEGDVTILSAPEGAAAYLWSTGETTQEIAITSGGYYTCVLTPVQGANCNVTVDITIDPFPVPQVAFDAQPNPICEGNAITFDDETVIDAGGVITTYQWNFGDGIETPHSIGAIVGIPQTTGTYLSAEHTYPTANDYDVTLTVYSEDGCYSSHTETVTVNPLPTAVINGDANVCVGDAAPQVTFTGASGALPYTFTYTVNNGPQQTVTTTGANTSVTVDAPTDAAGAFVYDLVRVDGGGAQVCGQAQNGSVTINVNAIPNAHLNSNVTVCQNGTSPEITFTGSNGTPVYTFTYTIGGGANQTISTAAGQSAVTINAPTDVVGDFVYNLILVEESSVSGCSQVLDEEITIQILPLPTATISGSIDLCQYEDEPHVEFEGANASAPYTFHYSINGGANLTVNSDATGEASVEAPTGVVGQFDYNISQVIDNNGCSSALDETISIEIHPLPTATITGTVEVCLNDAEPEVVFEGINGIAPFTFTYNLNGGGDQAIQSVGTNASMLVPTNQPGSFVYNLTYVEESSPLTCGQTLDQTVTVIVHDLPIVSAGNDVTVCEGFTVVLTGSGAQSYEWDNNVTNGVSFIPTQSGIYTVIGTDQHGCQNTDDMQINWIPTPQVNFFGDNLDGCMPVHTTFNANATGNIASCQWNFGDGASATSCDEVTHTYAAPGCFDVSYTVTTTEGCVNTLILEDYICAYPYPIADFTPTPNILSTIAWESQMINESSGATDYVWDFGDNSAVSNEHSPFHEFPADEGGTYVVTLWAISEYGCRDSINNVVVVNEELLYYVPNAFTPDNDDYNEVFKPIFTQGFDPFNYNLLIFNRWGEVLFESNDAEYGWNGTYGGTIVQDGVYIWKITFKVKGVDKRQTITGHVTLIR